mgnify:CR=1 FL=1
METLNPGLNVPALNADDSYLFTVNGDALTSRDIHGWVDAEFTHYRLTPAFSPNNYVYIMVQRGWTVEVVRPTPETLQVFMYDEDGLVGKTAPCSAIHVIAHPDVDAGALRDWYEQD